MEANGRSNTLLAAARYEEDASFPQFDLLTLFHS
jgi:hypothetical protein